MAKNKSRARKRKAHVKRVMDPMKIFDLSPFEAMVGSMNLIRIDIASKNQLFSPTHIKQSFNIDLDQDSVALITENGLVLKDLLPGFLARIPEIEQRTMDFITEVRTAAFTDQMSTEARDEIQEKLTSKGQELHEEYSDWSMTYMNSIQPIYMTVVNHLNNLTKEKPAVETVDGATL